MFSEGVSPFLGGQQSLAYQVKAGLGPSPNPPTPDPPPPHKGWVSYPTMGNELQKVSWWGLEWGRGGSPGEGEGKRTRYGM